MLFVVMVKGSVRREQVGETDDKHFREDSVTFSTHNHQPLSVCAIILDSTRVAGRAERARLWSQKLKIERAFFKLLLKAHQDGLHRIGRWFLSRCAPIDFVTGHFRDVSMQRPSFDDVCVAVSLIVATGLDTFCPQSDSREVRSVRNTQVFRGTIA